jgi:hypothetical protein
MEQILDVLHDTLADPLSAASDPAPATPTQPRFDIYAIIHKGLRAAMTDALLAAGRVDARDAREVTDTVARVDALLGFCQLHLEKENRFVHPAMEARRPGSTRGTAIEHVEHEAAIARLRRRVDALARAPAAIREAAAHDLYVELSLFVGENLVHMHEEETKNNAVLWDCYADAEIAAIELEIRSQLTPPQMQYGIRWMLPAMTPAQRAGMLKEMRAAAPAPVYTGVLAAARAHVDADGWRKLEAALAD